VSRWMTWLPISLKNAAKCDKQCELQTVSHQNFECNLHLRLARGMFASVYPKLSFSLLTDNRLRIPIMKWVSIFALFTTFEAALRSITTFTPITSCES